MDKAIRSAKLTAKGMDKTSENIADYVADLLRQGRAKEITDDLMEQADPQRLMHHYKSGNTGMDLPMDKASRMERAKQMGLTEDSLHGTLAGKDFSRFKGADRYGSRLGQENYVAPNTTDDRKLAAQFSTGDQGRVMPLLTPKPLDTSILDDRLRFEKMMDDKNRLDDFRMKGGYRVSGLPGWGDQWAIDTVNEAGVPAMKLHERDWVTSTAVFDPTKMRSQFARFDPRLEHLAHLSASTGGAMDFARHVEAVHRAGGQIAPSKYLPDVPRQVHAGGGKVAFMQGNHPDVPEVLYHGTGAAKDFSSFSLPGNKTNRKTGGNAIYLSTSPETASTFANYGESPRVMPVHVSAKNPFDFRNPDHIDALQGALTKNFKNWFSGAMYNPQTAINWMRGGDFGLLENDNVRSWMKRRGHDSYFVTEGEGKPLNLAVFKPEQIKSAIGNQGTFDPNDPDITKAGGGDVEGDEDGITAYHGSPHDFDQFDISKLGTGEGAQAYGHGLYFAGNEKIAKHYRDLLSNRSSNHISDFLQKNGVSPDVSNAYSDFAASTSGGKGSLNDFKKTLEQEHPSPVITNWRKNALSEISKLNDATSRLSGRMYKVKLNVKPEELLDWDKPLSEQHPRVQEVLRTFGAKPEDTGAKAYLRAGTHKFAVVGPNGKSGPGGSTYEESLAQVGGDPSKVRSILDTTPQARSAGLLAQGIKGIRYRDAGSRDLSDGDPTHNYVMFHHDPVQVMDKYEYGGTVAIPKAQDVSAALALTRRFSKDGTGATLALKSKGK